MPTDETSSVLIFTGFACRSCVRGVIFIPHEYSTYLPASMPKYKIRLLPVLCGDCEQIIRGMGMGMKLTTTSVGEMTEDEVKSLFAFTRMQLLPNAEVEACWKVAWLGVVTVASIGHDFKRGCDVVSPYVSGSIDDYRFGPPPASFF